jgi:hypothetical protein
MSLTDSNTKKNYSNKTSKNIKVAELPEFNKKKLNIIRQIGNKAGNKFSVNKLLNKKAKIIQINIGPGKKKE